jgi:hypothetical protein
VTALRNWVRRSVSFALVLRKETTRPHHLVRLIGVAVVDQMDHHGGDLTKLRMQHVKFGIRGWLHVARYAESKGLFGVRATSILEVR